MALLTEGIWGCTALSAVGGDDDKGFFAVVINVEIAEGPDKGRRCTYTDQVHAKSAPYVAASCKSVGWKGQDLTTLKDDCAAWIARTGGKTTVEVKHLEIKSGKRAGQIWDKINSIGRGSRTVNTPSASSLADANEAVRRALEASGGGNDAQPVGDPDDIPFITCTMSADVSPIAKVLR